MSAVVEKIAEELQSIKAHETAPGQAALALALAESIDETTGATSRANAARELRTLMETLHKLAPVGEEGDALDDLTRRREERRARGA
ncbi:hypothetical protein [Streptomyces sp. NPDC058254]|uniref:hypothetical protein n=1 Tax=Streptomyces sp. NPDC058254 TaxID=3346406 RepID=UPI0036ED74AC